MHDSLCIIHHDLQMTLFYVSFSVISRHLFCHSLRSARRRMPPKGSGKGRKRSAGGDVQIDPALFLEGTVAGRYKATSMLKEPHGQHLWSVSVCSIRPDNHGDVFATVGSNCASVYRLENDGGMTVLRSFKDGNEHEMFLACAWCEARGGGGALLLAVAGETGVIRVLNVSEEAKTDEKTGSANIVYRDMRGHGGAVNDLKAHPCAPHFLLSASRDESCRLWNVDNGVCVAIFAGAFGHKNEVLSVDIKPNVLFFGKKGNGSDREPSADDQDDRDFVFVSGAMDMCVKVWTTRGYLHLLELSETWPDLKNAPLARVGCSRSEIFEKDNGIKTFLDDDDGQGKLPSMSKPFPTANVQTPLFSSHKVHGSYVDCVRWFGDLLLTKSVEQCLKLWAPELRHDGRVGESFRKVKEFPAKYADIYYLRFAVDVGAGAVVCGNRKGQMFVWNANAGAGYVRGGDGADGGGMWHVPPALFAKLSEKSLQRCIRHAAVAFDGRCVLAACDGGTVYRWDWVPDAKKPTDPAAVARGSRPDLDDDDEIDIDGDGDKRGGTVSCEETPTPVGDTHGPGHDRNDDADLQSEDDPSVVDLLSESDEPPRVRAEEEVSADLGRGRGQRSDARGASAGTGADVNRRRSVTQERTVGPSRGAGTGAGQVTPLSARPKQLSTKPAQRIFRVIDAPAPAIRTVSDSDDDAIVIDSDDD